MTLLLDIHGHFFNVLTQMYLICLSFGSKVCEVLINAANISYERLAELKNVGPENIQGEANPRQERKTEQANPTVDQVRRSRTKTNIKSNLIDNTQKLCSSSVIVCKY